ncbi:MAG TPA: Re/Si-specific NAD(P)(+) transhydrogenase subunit alpha [Gemmatimonadaceae bacterium]|nr:Re/Si-specific NAD(P)(+) transhydrogenase subunit alpha [Gemmatimonadaceae bacterium]
MRISVPKESAPNERRVALVPDGVGRLVKAGHEVTIERAAGERAGFRDAQYESAGGKVVDAARLFDGTHVVAMVRKPSGDEIERLPTGVALISLMQPAQSAETFAHLARRGVTAFALELVPRITRAQAMDALSSQSTVAGYKAVLLGAAEMGKLLPMLTTAAGTLAPARAFIIGAGVAGLQAIATARRLGAIVSAFDVRAAAREQVQSLGASFVGAELDADAETKGGYARAQTEDEQARTLAAIGKHIVDQDLVITTAQIPGRAAPTLITEEMVHSMRPGAVIVDLAAETGGNVAVGRPGETIRLNGVTIVSPLDVPATVPMHASQMLSKNIETFLAHIGKEGTLRVSLEDEIAGPMCVVHEGQVRYGTPKS